MPFTNLLVAVDGSEASNRALSKALELAALTRASVTALAVWRAHFPPTQRPWARSTK